MPTKFRYVPLLGRGPVWPVEDFPVLIDGFPRDEDLDRVAARERAWDEAIGMVSPHRQDERGQTVCNFCHGDWYACDC